MIQNRWDQSLSPGNEQAFYWGSAAAEQPGTRNYMGVKSPAVDAMIATLLKVEDRGDFVAAVRALDRGRPTGDDLALRLPSRNLVARAEGAMKCRSRWLDSGRRSRRIAPRTMGFC